MLCRLLKAVDVPGIPTLSPAHMKQFVAQRDHWWSSYTNCIAFAKQSKSGSSKTAPVSLYMSVWIAVAV